MSDSLTEQLFQRGALMSLYIGRWGAMKKMGADDLLLGKVDNDALYLGHKKLLPKKAMEKLVEIEGKARNLFASKSIDFPIAGARFVTFSAVPEIVDGLKELRDEWNEEVKVLIDNYSQMKVQQLALLEQEATRIAGQKLFASPASTPEEVEKLREEMKDWLQKQKLQNESFYPPPEQLPQKFSFMWRMFRISNIDGSSELDPEDVRNAQERLRSDLNEWVASATAQIHQTLGEAAQNARGLLERNGKLTPRNIKPLFDAFESFMSVDFTGKSSFRETIETLQKGFLVQNPDGTYSASMAESVSSSTEFAGLLQSLSTLAVADIAKKAGGESMVGSFGRLLDI